MSRVNFTALLAAAALSSAACASGPAQDDAAPAASGPLSELSWLSGHWRAADENGSVEEIWTDADGGLMLGVNRTIRGGKAEAFEFLRIAATEDGGAAYLAQPGGKPATPFSLTESGEGRAVFTNPEHDFPQEIRYAREGDAMTVTISLIGGENAMSWTWRRVD